MAKWTFFTNHAHVLLCVARDPGIRHRDVAERVGITERAAQRIVGDLIESGFLERTKEGRRNHYQVNPERSLRHPVEEASNIGEILGVLQHHDPPRKD